MTQKTFDVNNKEDMDLLWSILPDEIETVRRNKPEEYYLVTYKGNPAVDILRYMSINWHDKTEITRPVNYEDMIGCVGWVGNSRDARDRIGILNSYYKGYGYPFETTDGDEFAFFTPAKKSELKFYGEDK